MSFYHKLNQEKSYRRGIFLAVSLAVAGLCSIYPAACFKNYSSKERAKLDKKVADLDRHQREDDEEWHRDHHPRVRNRSHSPPRIAHMPGDSHHHRRRRHSSARPSERRESRPRHERYHDEDYEMSPARGSHRGSSRHAYDRELDRERRQRHAPPRRYHHSS